MPKLIEVKQIKLSIQQEIARLTTSKELIQQHHQPAQHEVSSWHQVAEAAMKQGREDLARKALERKLAHQQNASILKTQLEQVTARIEALRGDLRVMERTIASLL